MKIEQADESLVMRWLNQVYQFVHYDIFQEIFRLLHKFRIQPDRARAIITCPSLGFHPLEIIL